MEYAMKISDFSIDFQLKVFEEDIKCPVNAFLTVSVCSNGFCATSELDIDIKKFKVFVRDLSNVYRTLSGTASVVESYGEQFVKFCGDGSGYIGVSGHLSTGCESGSVQKLFFENAIDQTYFPDFIKKVSVLCEKY